MRHGPARGRWRPRVWTLQAAVVLVAVGLGTADGLGRMSRRRAERLARALQHAQVGSNQANFSAFHAQRALLLQQRGPFPKDPSLGDVATEAAKSQRTSREYALKARFHLELERKFQYAADHPWLAAPIEPAEPP